MKRKSILLNALLLSTSQRNILKYCKDKKKKGRIIGTTIGMALLYLMLVAYCIAQSIGFGYFGLTDSIPTMNALVISLISFFFTLFKTNGYLFNFKEYDMLMSLPFKAKDVAGCKFLYMYVKSLPWQMTVSLSTMVVYGIYSEASPVIYPVWIALSLFLPIIPMLIASFFGYLLAKIGSGFKHKTLVQTILVLLFTAACFVPRFFIEDMIKNDKTEEVMHSVSSITGTAEKFYPPANWFSNAVKTFNISDILLLIGITIILFEIIFIPVGRSYRKINSALKSHAASKKKVKSTCKQRSVLGTIVFKEFKRMTGSTIYMTNAPIGELLCLAAGIAILFFDVDSILAKMTQGAPITKEMLYPAIPFIVYFFAGMVATTAFTPSLEGKNYWIVQSLPIKKETLYKGKMLFNLYLTVPVTLFSIVTFSISAKAPILTTLLSLVLGFVLCAFSTTWGCVCGIKHMRLDWENEIEVIKQGAAVALYLFPNMLACMLLIGFTVGLGMFVDQNIVLLIMIAFVSLLAGLNYRKVISLSRKQ